MTKHRLDLDPEALDAIVDARLQTLLEDPGEVAHYDRNGDGTLDEDERAFARRVVWADVYAEHVRASLDDENAAPGLVADRFQIVRELGKGGRAPRFSLKTGTRGGELRSRSSPSIAWTTGSLWSSSNGKPRCSVLSITR